MKNLSILLFVSGLLINSCKYNDEKILALEEISISALRNSNFALLNLSKKNYSSLSAKLKNAIYGDKVPFWNKKAENLKVITKETLDQLEIINQPKFYSIDSVIKLKNKFLNNIKVLDSPITKIFKKDFDSFLKKPNEILSSTFIIEKTKNEILYLESILSQYLNEQLGLMERSYTVFSTLLGQNTTHLRSGEILEITAGLGSYTLAANPKFIINGNVVNPDGEARVSYKLKVSGKGKQNVPVKILYTSPEGLQEFHDFTIEYIVE